MLTKDASPAVVGFLKNRAVGLLCADLLAADRGFEALLRISNDKKDLLARGGPLLLEQVADPQYVALLARDLVESLQSILWVELLQHITSKTRCKFMNFGTFYRWKRTISFDSAILVNDDSRLEPYVASDVFEATVDALCRTATSPIRTIAHDLIQVFAKGGTPSALAEPLLTRMLTGLFRDVKPPTSEVMSLFSAVTAFATYYVWTIAFGMVVRRDPVLIDGVGSFELASETPFSIRFSADQMFRDLIATKIDDDTEFDIDANPPIRAA